MPDVKHTCMSCGGMVGADGFALDLEEGSGESPMGEESETEQSEAGERLHEGAFADAVKRKRGA